MRNVLRVLKRDIVRLVKVPPALVVIGALLVLPSLYTWYNVRGFWDPYENTGDLSVCVVDEDIGAQSDLTGFVNVGDMIVDELHENHQLDWRFPSYDQAMEQLRSGECYAVFVIPEDFSADLLTLTTGTFQQPDIKYYVNEKTGPVAPKITDTGANTLDATINEAFVETVSKKAAEALDAAVDESNQKLDTARSAASQKVDEARAHLQDASSAIASLTGEMRQAQERAGNADGILGAARDALSRASDAVGALSHTASDVQDGYTSFTATATPAVVDALGKMADAYSEAVRALDQVPVQTPEFKALLEQLRASADKAQSDADRYSQILADELVPAVGSGLGTVAGSLGQASGTIAAQNVLISQTQAIVDDMTATLASSATALDQTQGLLDGLVSQVDQVQTDALALAGSDALARALGDGQLDPSRVAEFISAPTRLVTEQLYPLNAYGAAMAPLFMNLTFWIGAFMLMVVMRQEVDAQGIKRLTLAQRYVGRYLLFALMCALQAAICCIGLPLIGVQVASLPALIGAAVVASLAYLSIIYALSVTLQHIGKGICIILVFAQIPGATGLYPVEMTSPFFQAIYPLLPFTYGISAMRESICGFYGTQYATDIALLLVYLVVFMAIGILVRPLLSNVNRMVARQIKQSGIFNGEDVEVPVRRFRLSQVARVLADREEYRTELVRRYDRFTRAYPWMIRGAVVVGVVVPVALTLTFSFGMTEKVILLTLWLGWLALVFMFLVVVESLRSSFERQLRLDDMSDQEIRDMYLDRWNTEQADVVHMPTKTAAATVGEGARASTSAAASTDVAAHAEVTVAATGIATADAPESSADSGGDHA